MHFVLSYALIALILVGVILAVSIQDLTYRKKEVFSLSEQTMEQSVNNIEDRFTEFSNLIQNISNNDNLKEIQRNDELNFYSSYKLMQELQNQCYMNSFVDAIYVMLPEMDQIIGSDGIISNTEFFHSIRYDSGEENYKSWMENMQNTSSRVGHVRLEKVRIGSDKQNVIIYSQPLVVSSSNLLGKGMIFLYISESRLHSLVANSEEMLEFSMSISDRDQERIMLLSASQGSDVNMLGDTFSISRTSNSGKHYSCVFSESIVLKQWYEAFLLTFSFILISVLAVATLCVFLHAEAITRLSIW